MKLSLLALTLASLLSACAFYVKPEPEPSVRVRPLPGARVSQPQVYVTEAPIISDFAPTQGAGSVYGLGETISFRVRASESGYATLTAIGPDGVTSVFARNVYVQGGTDVYLPTPEERTDYVLAPPRGLQRVTLSFSSNAARAVQTVETSFYIQ